MLRLARARITSLLCSAIGRAPFFARPPRSLRSSGTSTDRLALVRWCARVFSSPAPAARLRGHGRERGGHAEHAHRVRQQILRARWRAAAALLPGEDGGDRQLLPEEQRHLDRHLPEVR
ncbi:hypothetical protein EYF80_064301 [Liparis tanakae]|uniref:Uncharacterized protein n=1 Tax=Liparis tanakae TaxID=230148 RepID=A0A4Z2E9S9_9TELE|nr:hypothetical protein EYF80_064301 [Liparis tanakae]